LSWFLALLVSLAALRTGITPIIPGLTEVMVGIFGLIQIVGFVWPGSVLLRNNPRRAA
jgi:hypothetical protein